MKRQKNENGFTLLELIIVVTIIGIISAAIVPQFMVLNKRTRLRVDVDSVKTLQDQINLYYQEVDDMPGHNLNEVISTLVEKEYIDERYIDMPNQTIYLETSEAEVIYDEAIGQVKLKVTPELYNLYLEEKDKESWLVSS